MFKKIDKTGVFIIIGLFLTSFFVCCSSCLNPFAQNSIDADTSVYLTVARGITEGKIPYRDFFDNKGPLLYLINAAGMFFAGFTGVWIIQLVFMCVSVFFAYKIALFFGDRFSAFFGVVFSFIVFRMFFYEVAGAEYSIPFMMVSLYIFTKYHYSQTAPSVAELITLGFCFITAIFIRINMFPLWLGFCLVVSVETILKQNVSLLFKYILFFTAGIIILFVPVMLYLYLNNALSDFISQNFGAGSLMAFQDSSIKETIKSFFIITGKHYSFLPFVVGSLWLIKNHRTGPLVFYIGYIIAFFLSVLFHAIIGTNHDHYNMVFVPFLVPAITFLISEISHYFSSLKYRKIAILLFFCVFFAGEIIAGLFVTNTKLTSKSRNEIIAVGKIIDKYTKEGDTIISLGSDRYIYLFTDRRPASRYIYQLSGAEFYPGTKSEFLSDMEKRPAIIVMGKNDWEKNNLPEWYSPVYKMIENEYQTLFINDNYYLFRKYVN